MTSRKQFIQSTGLAAAALLFQKTKAFSANAKEFISKRPPLADRNFTSEAVEAIIKAVKKQIADPELAWLFENCFPNTLDTTVDFEMIDGKPDTYEITGDIDAMWLRDSTAQVWPYLPLMKNDKHLQQLIAGVINRQVKCIHLDRYANAFYKDPTKISEWKSDITEMKPGVHERKWEIDSLCYPIRLAHQYWKDTGDTTPFDKAWEESIELIVKTFIEQQRKHNKGPYSFQRTTAWATDGVPLSGYGYPVKPVGLICSMFRPSDDATIFPFLITSNFFAVVSLRNAAEMVNSISKNKQLAEECTALANEVDKALKKYAVINSPQAGKIYGYEINGFGSFNLMDDANIPSLLSLPYLNAVPENDMLYQSTRKFVLSENNPFFFKGSDGEGVGGPHAGMDMIWPMSIIMRGLTSNSETEVKQCMKMLIKSNAGTGFMHESFNKNDVSNFTRKWFAWANTLFGEFVIHTSQKYPSIIQTKF
jgi:meiotically up-regulated gene 157 (Mug157) protein